MTKRFLTLEEKSSIVSEAFSTPNNVSNTARKYKVARSQIRRWKTTLTRLNQAGIEEPRKQELLKLRRLDIKPHETGSEADQELKKYVQELRDQHRVVSVRMICREWQRLHPEVLISSVAVRSRVYRWLKREGFVHRRPTRVSQKTRLCQKTAKDFLLYVREQVRDFNFSPETIVNIDETNVDFDCVAHSTVNRRGERTVSIRCSGSSQRVTVLLAVTKAGTKLSPFLVFKGSKTGRIVRELATSSFPSTCCYSVQHKAWVDNETLLEWLEKVYKPWSREHSQTYLLLDEARTHLSCGKQLRAVCGEVDYIPAGYTSTLQVLDVSVNKPFKDYLRDFYETWMVENVVGKPSRLDVAKWVDAAWKKISEETIKMAGEK